MKRGQASKAFGILVVAMTAALLLCEPSSMARPADLPFWRGLGPAYLQTAEQHLARGEWREALDALKATTRWEGAPPLHPRRLVRARRKAFELARDELRVRVGGWLRAGKFEVAWRIGAEIREPFLATDSEPVREHDELKQVAAAELFAAVEARVREALGTRNPTTVPIESAAFEIAVEQWRLVQRWHDSDESLANWGYGHKPFAMPRSCLVAPWRLDTEGLAAWDRVIAFVPTLHAVLTGWRMRASQRCAALGLVPWNGRLYRGVGDALSLDDRATLVTTVLQTMDAHLQPRLQAAVARARRARVIGPSSALIRALVELRDLTSSARGALRAEVSSMNIALREAPAPAASIRASLHEADQFTFGAALGLLRAQGDPPTTLSTLPWIRDFFELESIAARRARIHWSDAFRDGTDDKDDNEDDANLATAIAQFTALRATWIAPLCSRFHAAANAEALRFWQQVLTVATGDAAECGPTLAFYQTEMARRNAPLSPQAAIAEMQALWAQVAAGAADADDAAIALAVRGEPTPRADALRRQLGLNEPLGAWLQAREAEVAIAGDEVEPVEPRGLTFPTCPNVPTILVLNGRDKEDVWPAPSQTPHGRYEQQARSW